MPFFIRRGDVLVKNSKKSDWILMSNRGVSSCFIPLEQLYGKTVTNPLTEQREKSYMKSVTKYIQLLQGTSDSECPWLLFDRLQGSCSVMKLLHKKKTKEKKKKRKKSETG